MNINDYKDICDILYELQSEFNAEEVKLRDISKDRSLRIDELDQQIYVARKNEDIDFRVFSPRNISKDNSEKINALEDEKAILEKEKKNADRQMYYYSGKSEKLEKVICILKKNMDIDYHEESDNVKSDVNDNDDFDVMTLFNDNNDDIPETFEKVIYESSKEHLIDNEISEKDNEDISDIRALFNDNLYDDSNENKSNNSDLNVNNLEENNIKADSNNKVDLQDNNNNDDTIIDVNSDDGISDKENAVNDDDKDILNDSIIKKYADDLERVCHKIEFTEKIITNDRVRAKIQLKDIISELKDIIKIFKK